MHHGNPAGRFARDRHLLRIATEGDNVALHPLQRGELIEESIVAGSFTRRGQRGMYEESEPPQAVVQAHHDQALARERAAVEYRRG